MKKHPNDFPFGRYTYTISSVLLKQSTIESDYYVANQSIPAVGIVYN